MVHWYEGQFLQPHLFQLAQRQWLAGRSEDRRLSFPYAHGLVEAQLSQNDLEAKRVRFLKLKAVMPSGLVVELGQNMELSDLDLSQKFVAVAGTTLQPVRVMLAVPSYAEGKPNTIAMGSMEDRRVRKLYREEELKEQPDDNTGDNPQSLSVRMINGRLITDTDDARDMEVLAVLRVRSQAEPKSGIPIEDEAFYPTTLLLNGSHQLKRKVSDLVTEIKTCREALVQQVSPGFNADLAKPRALIQMMRLQTLNRFASRLEHAGGGEAMFEVYLQLRELHGELAALAPDRDMFPKAPRYDHDQPAVWFDDLDRQIRKMLLGDMPNKWRKIDLKRDERSGWLRGELSASDYPESKAFYVGITSHMDPDTLRRLVQDEKKFKFMAESQLGYDIYGIRLFFEPNPPLELPSEPGLRYFRVSEDQSPDNMESYRKWKQLVNERKFAVRWQQSETVKLEFSAMSLYMVLH
jgi:type VI secretion system ImpJ/VasE family protein